MALSEHETLYSPSRWSKRCSPAELLAQFIKAGQDATDEARSTTCWKQDVAYGTTERSKYDVYGTDLPDNAPIFVFLHGGYWHQMDKDLSGFAIKTFVSEGIKVVIANYDRCPTVKVGDIVAQIKILIETILKLADDLGSRGVWLGGHSCGAHLAASLVFDADWLAQVENQNYGYLLRGLVLVGGIYHLKPLLDTAVNNLINLTSEEVKMLSFGAMDVQSCKLVRSLKVILAIGECDSPAFIQESRRLAQKLIDFVDNVEHILFRDCIDHFNILENLTDSNFSFTKLLIQNIHCR